MLLSSSRGDTTAARSADRARGLQLQPSDCRRQVLFVPLAASSRRRESPRAEVVLQTSAGLFRFLLVSITPISHRVSTRRGRRLPPWPIRWRHLACSPARGLVVALHLFLPGRIECSSRITPACRGSRIPQHPRHTYTSTIDTAVGSGAERPLARPSRRVSTTGGHTRLVFARSPSSVASRRALLLGLICSSSARLRVIAVSGTRRRDRRRRDRLAFLVQGSSTWG